MLDAAVKALSQILSPPMRSILWRSIGLALALITVLAIGLQRLLSFLATSGEGWLEAMLGPWLPDAAQCAGLDRLDRRRSRHRVRRGPADARDHLAGGERVRRRGRRPCRARALSGGTSRRGAAVRACHDRRRQDRGADDPGLSDRAAVRAFRRRRLSHFLHRDRVAVGSGIFRARGDALPPARRSQGDAERKRRRHFHCRPDHRGLRVDPSRQSGDAAVRHGVHGPHAQALERTGAGTDRAAGERPACQWRELAPRPPIYPAHAGPADPGRSSSSWLCSCDEERRGCRHKAGHDEEMPGAPTPSFPASGRGR